MKKPYSYYENWAKTFAKYVETVRTNRPEEVDAIIVLALIAASTWDVDDSELTQIAAVITGKKQNNI